MLIVAGTIIGLYTGIFIMILVHITHKIRNNTPSQRRHD
jgi:TRAP-type C4-dicarboxylate transport system permease large subunit